MKKLLKYIALAAILTLTSCSKDEIQTDIKPSAPVFNMPTNTGPYYKCYRLTKIGGPIVNGKCQFQIASYDYQGRLVNWVGWLSATDYPTSGHYHNKVKMPTNRCN